MDAARASWGGLVLFAVFSVAALDAPGIPIPRVHKIHNFPDLLAPWGLEPPKNLWEGTCQAALSGVLAAAPPALAAYVALRCTTEKPSDSAWQTLGGTALLLALLTLFVAVFAPWADAFFVHKCMYLGFFLALAAIWTSSVVEG